MRQIIPTLAMALTLATMGGRALADFSAAGVYRDASPSVVLILSVVSDTASSTGTGSIVTRDGLVLTNAHVVGDPKTGREYDRILVFLKPDRVSGDVKRDLTRGYRAEVIARDNGLDLALLRMIDPPGDLRAMSFGDSEQIEIGASVAAIGHPGGGGMWTLTTGTISSTRRDGERDIFQTDTAINPGNSGGPLLDGDARLIGINTFVRRVNQEGLPLEGLNYSVRSQLAMSWMQNNGVNVAIAPATAAPAMSPATTPPASTTPPAPAAPPASTTRSAPTRPAPQTSEQQAPPPRPPPVEDEAREFQGREGEMMFGVPNKKYEPKVVNRMGRDLWNRAVANADKSFDDLDKDEDFEDW